MKVLIHLASLLFLVACDRVRPPIVIFNSCNIDEPASNVALEAARDFSVSGWAFDRQSGTLPEHVRIQFTSSNRQFSKTFDAKLGGKRPDVVKVLDATAAESSGFHLTIPANTLVAENYEIAILQDMAEATLVCGNVQVVRVK